MRDGKMGRHHCSLEGEEGEKHLHQYLWDASHTRVVRKWASAARRLLSASSCQCVECLGLRSIIIHLLPVPKSWGFARNRSIILEVYTSFQHRGGYRGNKHAGVVSTRMDDTLQAPIHCWSCEEVQERSGPSFSSLFIAEGVAVYPLTLSDTCFAHRALICS